MTTIVDTLTNTEDAVELDVQVTTEAPVGYTVRGCTSDGCRAGAWSPAGLP